MCSISYYLLDKGRGIKLIATGNVDGEALVAANRRFLTEFDTQFAQCEYWYSDYSNLNGAGVLPQHAKDIANLSLQSSKDDLLLATFAPGTLEFGMTRMWEALTDRKSWKAGVFRNIDELTAWLNAESGRPVELTGGDHIIDYPGKLAR